MRKRLRKKEAKDIAKDIGERFGIRISTGMELVKFDGREVILVDGEPLLFKHEGGWYPTVLSIIKLRPEAYRVVVDEGALRYVINGADIMKPGIVWADEKIKKGDFVYIAVEKKGTPIAVGIALVDGKDMSGGKGKAVKNLHHLKDKIWARFFGK
jgi:PUA domain protein